MGKPYLPTEIDEYFLFDIILVFLMINYNLPLATIYFSMVILGALMYLVPIQFGLFKWIPFAKPNSNKFMSILVGVGAGVGFIWLYNYLQASPIGTVFATTAFGDSIFLGQLVFGILVAAVETRFFFRTLLQWFAWKTNLPVNVSPLSKAGLILITFFAAVFTLFHATAFGVSNTVDLSATFIFGALSIGMILHFQQLLEAIIMHVVVNSKGVGIFDDIISGVASGALIGNTWVMIAAGGVLAYWLFTRKKFKLG